MKEMSGEWHLRVFRKSLLKQAKLNAIRAFLPDLEGKACLDLGGDNGIISYFLRKGGGIWHSADLSFHAVESIRALAHTNVFKKDGSALPSGCIPCSIHSSGVFLRWTDFCSLQRGIN